MNPMDKIEIKSRALKLELNDQSNADLIVEMFGDKIRFDHKRDRWLIWGEHRWKPDSDGQVIRFAIKAAKERFSLAAQINDPDLQKKYVTFAISSKNASRVKAALDLLKNTLPIADAGENWDSNPMLLSCANGILDLTTGILRVGVPEDRITMCTGTKFDVTALCPRWEKFISEVFENNPELISYIKKACGYSLTGSESEQAAFFCFGSGSNGKSVFFKAIKSVLGDYAYDAPASLFQRNIQNTQTNDVAATEGRRFLISSETLSTSKLNEQRLKAWTGGDTITCRFLHKEFFSFEPTAKPWLFINHKPQVEDDSYGFWRRVKLIPFNKQFKGADADPNLLNVLISEKSGILNWLIEGCLLWKLERLFPEPEIVRLATQEYKGENDVLSDFIVDCCVEEPEQEVRALTLYQNYQTWASNNGLNIKDILSQTSFGRKMNDKFIKIRTKQGNAYKGIGLKGVGFTEKVERGVGLDPQKHITTNKNTLHEEIVKTTPNPTLEANNPTPTLHPFLNIDPHKKTEDFSEQDFEAFGEYLKR